MVLAIAVAVSLGSSSTSGRRDLWQGDWPLSAPATRDSPPVVVDNESGWMKPHLLALWAALRSHISHLEVRIHDVPEEIERLKQGLSDRIETYRLIVADCSDVDLTAVAVPDESIIQACRQASPCYEYLTTLPRELACWLINHDIKKASQKIFIKEKGVERMDRIRKNCHELLTEIEGLTDATDIVSFYLDTFGILASDRGKWLVAVKQLAEARMRLDMIKAEFALFRDAPYIKHLPNPC